jgi:hypothetical protein
MVITGAPSASRRWTSASTSSVSKSRCIRSLASFSSSVRCSSTESQHPGVAGVGRWGGSSRRMAPRWLRGRLTRTRAHARARATAPCRGPLSETREAVSEAWVPPRPLLPHRPMPPSVWAGRPACHQPGPPTLRLAITPQTAKWEGRGLARCHWSWSVSSPRPSNRACGSPAHGLPTFFTGDVRPASPGRVWAG